jgi:hypothetical protein
MLHLSTCDTTLGYQSPGQLGRKEGHSTITAINIACNRNLWISGPVPTSGSDIGKSFELALLAKNEGK